jgi:hypothetical protein
LSESDKSLNLPSNKVFGWFFAIFFSLMAFYFYFKSWVWGSGVLITFSFAFLVIVMIAPRLLSPLNILWHRLGLFLGLIVSPIVLGIIFFLMITPVSMLTRLFGRDELKMKKRSINSYWVDRPPLNSPADTFKNQF